MKGHAFQHGPPYFGHPVGARVAPQRCPILQKGMVKIQIAFLFCKKYFVKKGT